MNKYVEKKLDEIIPYENNPRINDEAVEFVKNSIMKFGFRNPIIVDKYGVIVCGHTRYKAAKELGLETVKCIVADDLTPEQIAAYRLADNKTAEMSQWDPEKLDSELEGIQDIDMTDFGFDLDDVGNDVDDSEDIGEFFEAAPESEPHEKEAPAKRTKTVTCPHCGEKFEVEI